MTERFDVVIVPDFLGRSAPVFEARTLFFLASWLENAGRAREFPLHLACIGEPPPAVRYLTSRCDAAISVHQPVEAGSSLNKLRGLEIQGREERVLLLDVDIIVCGDFSRLGEIGHCIAASPAGKPRVPERYWERIYRALGLERPSERIACILGELNCPPLKVVDYPGQNSALHAMTPYYNSGVIFVPWEADLRLLWEEHLRTISALFSQEDPGWRAVTLSDQAGLATAIEVLRRRGLPFRRLPNGYHAHWLHLYRRALRLREVKLLHAFGLFRGIGKRRAGLRQQVAQFLGENMYRIVQDLWRPDIDPSQRASVAAHLVPSARETFQLGLLLHRLYKNQVVPALRYQAKGTT